MELKRNGVKIQNHFILLVRERMCCSFKHFLLHFIFSFFLSKTDERTCFIFSSVINVYFFFVF